MPPQVLEINPKHPIIISLAQSRTDEADIKLSKLIAEQLFDNALISAGLIEDSREMIPRLNKILANALGKK